MSHVSSSGKRGGIHILKLYEVVCSSFISKTRVIPWCSCTLNWSAKPPVLGREKRKYVLKQKQMRHILSSMSMTTLASVFLKDCFSYLHLQHLLEVTVSWVPRWRRAHPFTYTLLGQQTGFCLWSPRSIEYKLPAENSYLCCKHNCISFLLQSQDPLVDQTFLVMGGRPFVINSQNPIECW